MDNPLNEICQDIGCSCTSKEAYSHPERCEIVRRFVKSLTENQRDMPFKMGKLINEHFQELV
jgi:hypothetical protein